VVLEALAMGLPVVTTRQNGASDLVEDGKQGIIVEHGDAAGLSGALEAMLDAGRLREMSREALALRARLSFDHHAERIEEVYARVMNARRTGAESSGR
jgi:UDP-glucose:(heptosyl)LPS alpha-1,3-glucosyltransferase